MDLFKSQEKGKGVSGEWIHFQGMEIYKKNILPSEKGSISKEKNLLPIEANSFLLE